MKSEALNERSTLQALCPHAPVDPVFLCSDCDEVAHRAADEFLRDLIS